MEMQKIYYKIVMKYYYGVDFFSFYKEDIIQEFEIISFENREKTFYDVYKLCHKRFFSFIAEIGYSKKLKKWENEICFPFYTISSLSGEEFKFLRKIEVAYVLFGYKAVLKLSKKVFSVSEVNSIKKLLTKAFPKKSVLEKQTKQTVL